MMYSQVASESVYFVELEVNRSGIHPCSLLQCRGEAYLVSSFHSIPFPFHVLLPSLPFHSIPFHSCGDEMNIPFRIHETCRTFQYFHPVNWHFHLSRYHVHPHCCHFLSIPSLTTGTLLYNPNLRITGLEIPEPVVICDRPGYLTIASMIFVEGYLAGLLIRYMGRNGAGALLDSVACDQPVMTTCRRSATSSSNTESTMVTESQFDRYID